MNIVERVVVFAIVVIMLAAIFVSLSGVGVDVSVNMQEVRAEGYIPSDVEKFTDGNVTCYKWISDIFIVGNTSRLGGISCVN